MNKIKQFLKPFYHKLLRMLKWYRRIGLKCKDFSIISNNCTGGYVYQYYGICYNTPTEGLYFTTEDYLKLVERPEYYFTQKVELIDPKQSTLARNGKDIFHPVGIIDDVEIYFLHYPNAEEALKKWYRRAARINYSKLFFLLTENEFMKREHLSRFSKLMGGGTSTGMCLTLSDYGVSCSKYIPNVPLDNDNGNASWKPEVIMNSINWKQVLNSL